MLRTVHCNKKQDIFFFQFLRFCHECDEGRGIRKNRIASRFRVNFRQNLEDESAKVCRHTILNAHIVFC